VNFKKLKLPGVIVIWLIFLSASLICIFAEEVDDKNTILISGNYSHLQKVVSNGRGGSSVSYNLYIEENKDFYKIGASNSDCFYPDAFENGVKEGQPIKIWLITPWLTRPMIVRVAANNVNYLSFNCANKKIDEERQSGPFLCFMLATLLSYIIYKKDIGIWWNKG